jgi:hypothetical protein
VVYPNQLTFPGPDHGWGESMRQGCLDSLERSFPVRTLTRRELTQFIVVIFLDGSAPYSLLACLLKHWKEMSEALYWGLASVYLGDQEKWPSQGSLNCNTILQLDLFCKRKKSKLRPLIQIFFYLRDHSDWFHNCYLDTHMLAILCKQQVNMEKEDQGSPLSVTKPYPYCSTLCPVF